MEKTALIVNRNRILDDMKRKRANHEWLNKHRNELRRQFPNRYVAVLDERVVGGEEDFRALLSKLRKKFPDPSLAAIEFMSKDEFVWVL